MTVKTTAEALWQDLGANSPALATLKIAQPRMYEVFKALFMAGVSSMVINVVEIMVVSNEAELLRICSKLLTESREFVGKTLRDVTGENTDSSAGVEVPPGLKL